MRPTSNQRNIGHGEMSYPQDMRLSCPGDDVGYYLLGPLELRRTGVVVPVRGTRQQTLLAALLLHPNQVSSVAYLIEAVWEKPPAAPESNLRTYVARLRNILDDPGSLVTRPGGYLLRVKRGECDATTFLDLTEPGRDPAARTAERLARALALWRGPALDGLPVGPRLEVELTRLADRRLAAALRYAGAAGELGRHDQIVAVLSGLVEDYPLREELWAQLILALHRCGRQADALAAYRQVAERLASELAVEPGPQLRDLCRRLLAPRSRACDVRSMHRQLPREIPEFTNRTAELRQLELLADPARPGRDTAPPTALAIEGMAGVGKTRLAVQAAHRMVRRGWFADIQLWADLHGFDSRRPPIDPADVLDNFLRVLGVPGAEVPTDPDARAALYRDRLAGRRALVVLDNVADGDQVRPLLPGDPAGLVLITSRRSLATLEGVVPLGLGLFDPADSVTLQARIAGPARVAAEPAAAERIAALCGHLPIALSLAARRLRTRPSWSMAELARRLEGSWDDVDTDQQVRATFDTSYRALRAESQRMFRLLGVHPGHRFTAASAAALVEVGVHRAERTLEHLFDEHLVQQTGSDGYTYHDLVRGYAAGRAMTDEPADDRIAALRRLLDWYLRSVSAAIRIIDPSQPIPPAVQPTGSGLPVPEFVGRDAALAWCEAERTTLVDTVRLAAELPAPAVCRQLASMLTGFSACAATGSAGTPTRRPRCAGSGRPASSGAWAPCPATCASWPRR